MTASEIAETLLNGNIALARHHLTHDASGGWGCMYDGAALALDVVAELAILMSADPNPMDALLAHERALEKVRRCLEGAP